MKKALSNKLYKIVAVTVAATMLLATMLSAIPVSADTASGYIGTMTPYFTGGGSTASTINAALYRAIQKDVTDFVDGLTTHVDGITAPTDITPENYPSGKNMYSYVQQVQKLTDTTEFATALAETVDISEASAFMFYVKLPANMAETKLYLEGQTFAANGSTQKWPNLKETDKDAYLLSADDAQWTSVKTVNFGVSKSKSACSAITLPAGFEGWVRVPFTSFNVADWSSCKLFRMDFYFDRYSATEPVSYGALMVVDKPTENLTSLTIGEDTINLISGAAYNTTKLSLGEVTSNDYYSLTEASGAVAQTAGIFNDENAKNYELTVGEDATGKVYSGDFYTAQFTQNVLANSGLVRPAGSGWATTEWIDISNGFVSSKAFTFSAESSVTIPTDRSYFFNMKFTDSESKDVTLSWNNNSSLIFYAKNTGTRANMISLTEATLWVNLNTGVDYYLLSNGSTQWQSGTTTTAYEGSKGYIELPAGFEGFVRIPCSNFLNVNSQTKEGDFGKIQVYPTNLGGDYGELTIGAFGTVDKTTENLMYISSTATENTPALMVSGAAYSVTEAAPTGTVKVGDSGITWSGTTVSPTSEDGYIATQLNTSNSTYMGLNAVDITYANDSILFHVVNNSDKATKGAIVANEWRSTYINKTYYILQAGASVWTTATVKQDDNTDGNGYVEIPANFSGWIKIPYASFHSNLKNDTQLSKLGFFPLEMYGSLTFSNIMTTSTAAADNNLYVDNGKVASLSDISQWFDKTVEAFDVTVSNGAVTTNAPADVLNASIAVSKATALSAGESLMLYAKTEKAASLKLALSETNSLMDEFTYYTVATNGEWTEKAVTDGAIALDAGFEGFVRIPASAFNSTDISKLMLGFANAATGTVISDFMIADDAAYDLDYIVIDGKKVTLFVELYDVNADGEIDICDLVYITNYLNDSTLAVPDLAADTDRSGSIDKTDITATRQRLINGPEDEAGEVALSRYLSEQGYTTAANYTGNNTATVDTVNF